MEDERLSKINNDKQNALSENNNLYDSLLEDYQKLYDQQNKYAEEYERTQNSILDRQLAFNERKINQQKEEARLNKETEEKKAKNDYTAFINPYGYQAESFANRGILNSGVSETAKLGGFNTYQNRLATANKIMQDAFVQYDNEINQARLNNDVGKAQNALAKLQMQLEYSQNYYNNKSDLKQNQSSSNQNIDNNYYNRYQTEYENIQNEKAKEEAIRQWEQEFAYQKQKDALAQSNWEKEYALSKTAAKTSRSSGSSSSGYNLSNTSSNSKTNQSAAKSNITGSALGSLLASIKPSNSNIDDSKFTSTGKTMRDLQQSIEGISDNAKIMKNGNKYYVSAGGGNYIEVTGYYTKRFR